MSAAENERAARVALSCLLEPGDPRMAVLVAEAGAADVLDALRRGHELGGIVRDARARLERVGDPARTLDDARRAGLRYVVPGDSEWPTQLDGLATAGTLHGRGGPPLGLWARGPLRLDRLVRAVAVVGSRSSTTYGTQVTAEIGATLGRAGWTTVSGAAFGIDQAAHRGALAVRGPTVAVLACGADRVYPAAHVGLLEAIAAEGVVVSEAPPGSDQTRLRFLSRNRLIAGLARGTVVVEAAARSGALNTANWTGRLHRPLLGVPGPVTSQASVGVHQLVRSGAAALVTGGDDVLEAVAEAGDHLAPVPRGPHGPRDGLTHRQHQVVDALPVDDAVSAEQIARAAGLELAEVRVTLLRLQDSGLVDAGPDGWHLTALGRR